MASFQQLSLPLLLMALPLALALALTPLAFCEWDKLYATGAALTTHHHISG